MKYEDIDKAIELRENRDWLVEQIEAIETAKITVVTVSTGSGYGQTKEEFEPTADQEDYLRDWLLRRRREELHECDIALIRLGVIVLPDEKPKASPVIDDESDVKTDPLLLESELVENIDVEIPNPNSILGQRTNPAIDPSPEPIYPETFDTDAPSKSEQEGVQDNTDVDGPASTV